MDRIRLDIYFTLIQSLLNSSIGEQEEILNANSELLSAELVEVMLKVAANLIRQNFLDDANRLMNIAGLIMGIYNNENVQKYLSTIASSLSNQESQIAFILDVLQAIADNKNTQEVVYSLLEANLEQLDNNFATVLQSWATATLLEAEPELAQSIAIDIGEFGILIRNFPLGNRAINLEVAITSFEIIAKVFTREAFPEMWATTQSNLGTAYLHRILGKRAENLETAIKYYLAALEVRAPKNFPSEWAMLQNNLGIAYTHRICGERAENLETALNYYLAALEIHTYDAFARNWADIQNNMGGVHIERIRGKKIENLETAIHCYHSALKVRTRQSFPQDWAMTLNNLGNAYLQRIKGSISRNIEASICCYNAALKVRNPQNFLEIGQILKIT